MYDVRISDSLYKQARRAAEAQHVSLEAFVEEALQTQLNVSGQLDEQDDAAVQGMFTSERLAHIDGSLDEVKSGKFFTARQVREHFSQKAALWQSSND